MLFVKDLCCAELGRILYRLKQKTDPGLVHLHQGSFVGLEKKPRCVLLVLPWFKSKVWVWTFAKTS